MATESGFDESRALLRNGLALMNRAVKMLTEAEEVLGQRPIIEARSATDCLRPRELSDLQCQIESTTNQVISLSRAVASPSEETELVIEVAGGDEQRSRHAECLAHSIVTHCGTANSKGSHDLASQEPTVNIYLDDLREEHELLEEAVGIIDKDIDALKRRIQQLSLPVQYPAQNL